MISGMFYGKKSGEREGERGGGKISAEVRGELFMIYPDPGAQHPWRWPSSPLDGGEHGRGELGTKPKGILLVKIGETFISSPHGAQSGIALLRAAAGNSPSASCLWAADY